MDWVFQITGESLKEMVGGALSKAASGSGDDIQVEDAEIAIAASAVLALVLGWELEDARCPVWVTALVAGKHLHWAKPMRQAASVALSRIASSRSELRCLWEESPEYGRWCDLLDRLTVVMNEQERL